MLPEPEGSAAAAGQPRRVLVVEDNVDDAEALRALLERMGDVVLVARDGPSVLQQVEAFGPQVVLFDVGLPEMDGIEVATRLRAHPGGDRLILVAVRGWDQDEDCKRTCEAGFDEHLIKPVDIRDIQRIVALPPDQLPSAPERLEAQTHSAPTTTGGL